MPVILVDARILKKKDPEKYGHLTGLVPVEASELRRYSGNTSGPGTQLKLLLSRIGIKATKNCACNARAAAMDARGPDWCEQNLDTIVGWLKEEHAKRKSLIPFAPLAVEQMVKLAIRRARKKVTNP